MSKKREEIPVTIEDIRNALIAQGLPILQATAVIGMIKSLGRQALEATIAELMESGYVTPEEHNFLDAADAFCARIAPLMEIHARVERTLEYAMFQAYLATKREPTVNAPSPSKTPKT